MISMKPWKYDHTVHPIEWRESQAKSANDKKKFRVGVLRTDGKLLLFYVSIDSTNPSRCR